MTPLAGLARLALGTFAPSPLPTNTLAIGAHPPLGRSGFAKMVHSPNTTTLPNMPLRATPRPGLAQGSGSRTIMTKLRDIGGGSGNRINALIGITGTARGSGLAHAN